ncbi:MAG: MoaD/ThiS family protein [Anaerolineaceae bacterium]|nr:MoaD/ThiS family protein [Anaerolineaceae bacterium]
MIQIKVKFFANLRVKSGQSQIELSLEQGATVSDMLGEIRQQYPMLTPHLGDKIVIAINHKVALRPDVLPNDAEILLMPPIAGG